MAAPTAIGERVKLPPAVVAQAKRLGRVLGASLGAVVFAFVVGAFIIAITGGDPINAYQALICGGFGVLCGDNAYPVKQISDTIVFTTPLILVGLSVAVAFRAGLFNIGAEGQLIMGTIASTIVGLQLASAPGWILL